MAVTAVPSVERSETATFTFAAVVVGSGSRSIDSGAVPRSISSPLVSVDSGIQPDSHSFVPLAVRTSAVISPLLGFVNVASRASRCSETPDSRRSADTSNADETAKALPVVVLVIPLSVEAIARFVRLATVARITDVAVLPAGHPLLDAPATLAQLAAEPFVLYPGNPRPSYADHVIALFDAQGLSLKVAQWTNELQTAIGLVGAGMGVTLVPASVQVLHRADIGYTPIVESTAT